MGFIDTMRAEGHAVESTCRVLREQGCRVAARTYRAWRSRRPAARTISEAQAVHAIREIAWTIKPDGRRQLTPEGLYGRRKMTAQLRRTAMPSVSAGAVDRAMRILGLVGVRRGKGIRTTTPAKDGTRAQDLLDRDFTADAPEPGVGDRFHLRAELGRVLLCRLHRRRLRPAHRGLVRLDIEDHRAGDDTVADGVVAARPRRPPRPARGADPSLRCRQPIHLDPVYRASSAGRHPALHRQRGRRVRQRLETIIGLFKTECIRTTVFHDGPYQTLADVEYATAGWVDWYNNRRLHGSIGMVPPVEYEQAHYAALKPEMQPV